MSVTDDLIANNLAYAEAFSNGDLERSPARKVAVVACMDARLDPARALGLEEGDAHVIRNAGGVVSESEIRDLAISQHLLGTEEIVLVQHTDCGLRQLDEEDFADRVEAACGSRPDWRVHSFDDLDESVRESIRTIMESPFIPNKSSVRGFVYDVKTGRLREIE
jgi:carbonic anhydrase